MFNFSGKAVLVTGAGQSIGKDIAVQFAQAGAMVGVNDILPERAEAVVNEIAAEGGKAKAYPFDVADVAAVRDAVDALVRDFGFIDIAICNAGIVPFGPFLEYTPEQFDRLLAVNLRGVYFTAQAAARHMARQGRGGRIILPSSVNSIRAVHDLSVYAMTKTAMISLARNLALELGRYRITVNALGIGATLGERNLIDDPLYKEHWDSVTPTGRVTVLRDITNAALFLCSDLAEQITGTQLVIDGGWTTYGHLSWAPSVTPALRDDTSKDRSS